MRQRPARTRRLAGTIFATMVALASIAPVASAQYFGRNKVQFDNFDFRVLATPHFEIHFYPSTSQATADAARMAERWYDRHVRILRQEYSANPIIFYADPPDFQQTNVIEGFIGQGTGGVTESLRERVIMPFTGVYAETDHVLGHELVHVSQYRIASEWRGGFQNLSRTPLWVIEGMAEYLSLGREDPNTAMWLRDALRRNDLPTIAQLTNDARYFPYRYGQAVWAYIAGLHGDAMVNELYRGTVQGGWENAIRVILKTTSDTLSQNWHAAIRREFGPVLAGRTAPDSVGRRLIAADRGDQNVAPVLSPDGRLVAFFSSRGLFGMDLFLADANTGEIVRQLTSVTTNPHFEALSFINSAGSWSPDGSRFAAVTYAEGDNEIDVFDVATGRSLQRIRPPGITAMSDPAWSPDGRWLAFSGMRGGISDLFLFDFNTGEATALTNDREAQLHPAWSPDGRTIAFVTEAGDDTDFGLLAYGPMRLALYDLDARRIRLLPGFERGKHINPQFSPDGRLLYFISDQDGVSDIYRMAVSSGEIERLTRVATGISGITALSPAISVARGTGTLAFNVFHRQGYEIHTLDAAAIQTIASPTGGSDAGLLPPGEAVTTSTVSISLGNPQFGLPAAMTVAELEAASRPFRSRLSLDWVGAAPAGVAFGGAFGVGVAGGVALGFSDMLGNSLVNAAVQAQGTFKDVGAQVFYLNRAQRWNWGLQAYHIPLLGAFATFQNTTFPIDGQQVPGTIFTQVRQRQFHQSAALVTAYPFSTTRRFELSAGFQRLSFDTEVDSFYVAAGGILLREARTSVPSPGALNFGTAAAALVGDYSFFGFTSPIAGGRYRYEVSPFLGTLNYTTLLLDWRRYLFANPFTLAIRALHYGRYGGDAESDRFFPLYLGDPTLIRGYDANTFTTAECTGGGTTAQTCPEFQRLNGSRVAVANIELRIPLFGTPQFGLLSVPFLPTEIAPFVDAGVAWTSSDSPELRLDRNTAERVPVVSAGVTARLNLLGAAVVEIFWVQPYHRQGVGSYWGFQLLPGW